MERTFQVGLSRRPEVGSRVRQVTLTINDSTIRADVPSDRLLVDFLRDDLDLVGTKLGCGIGVCGLCAVQVDGQVMSACLLPVVLVAGADVRTIEGLETADGELSPLQEAFIREGAFQCGICTPGQLIAAEALLRASPRPTNQEIREWMAGSLCRCTGYEAIVRAIERASELSTDL